MTTPSTRAHRASRDLGRAHEHGWLVESAHATSLGRVLYVRCSECGTRRVDVQHRSDAPPTALTGDVD